MEDSSAVFAPDVDELKFSRLGAVVELVCSCKYVQDVFLLANGMESRLRADLERYFSSAKAAKVHIYQHMFLEGLGRYLDSSTRLTSYEQIRDFAGKVQVAEGVPWFVGLLQSLWRFRKDGLDHIEKPSRSRQEAVGILVCIYNETRFAELCLKSIRKYTQWPHYIVAVNNSTANVQEFRDYVIKQGLVDEWFDSGHTHHGQGLQSALAKVERFRYIATIDGDAIGLKEYWLDELVERLKGEAAGLIGPERNPAYRSIIGYVVQPSCMVIDQDVAASKFEIDFRSQWPFWDVAGLVTWDCLAHNIPIIKVEQEEEPAGGAQVINKSVKHYRFASRITGHNDEEVIDGQKVKDIRERLHKEYNHPELQEVRRFNPMAEQAKNSTVKRIDNGGDVLKQLGALGLWQQGGALRLHLGCGEQHFDGYVNIDYPPSEHNLIQPRADVYADVTKLNFPAGSVDEIRLHHLFEHFSRVVALAMLIKWHQWLRIGGVLCIETPDLIGSAKTLVSNAPWKRKMGVVRHLAGDQSAGWAYHLDHWFAERFERTLERLGFESIRTASRSWLKEPYLSNVTVVAAKSRDIVLEEQSKAAEQLLWESIVAAEERPKWEIWKKRLCAALAGDFSFGPGNVQTSGERTANVLNGFNRAARELEKGTAVHRQQKSPVINDWIGEGDVVFDVGAHIGSKTDIYLTNGARVVCFEPHPGCAKLLREKYQDNGKVTVVGKGLADKAGQRQLLMCSSASTISTFSQEWQTGRFADYSWDKTMPVEVTTLDEMIKIYGRPKFCKIDVEGFEFEVLKGLSQLIPYLSFEFTIEFLENAKRCLDHLERLGYRHFNLALDGSCELVLPEWVSSEKLFGHIQHLNHELLWGDIYVKADGAGSGSMAKPDSEGACVSGNIEMSGVSVNAAALAVLSESASQYPLDEITNFNQRSRDRWVQARAKSVCAGARVLDIGAGTCPYRSFFSHCDYKTHDFKRYDGVKLGNTNQYGKIDYESDITNIPVPDESFDVLLCTEVLEHIPEPTTALREMARILRPGGRIFLTAPLGSGLHQMPYHYYGGFTPQWYKHFLPQFGFQIEEIVPNGGFFKLLAQECARVKWTLPQHQHLHGDNVEFVRYLFGQLLPSYLFGLEEKVFIDEFTVGYHVEAVRVGDTKVSVSEGETTRSGIEGKDGQAERYHCVNLQ